jgi:hypothetical protein
VGDSALSALATMNMPSQDVMGWLTHAVGQLQWALPERMTREGWLLWMATPNASTGRMHFHQPPQLTSVLQVQKSWPWGPGVCALEQRRLEALSPYNGQAWASKLKHHSLHRKYLSLPGIQPASPMVLIWDSLDPLHLHPSKPSLH